jgi:hypothetical protein
MNDAAAEAVNSRCECRSRWSALARKQTGPLLPSCCATQHATLSFTSILLHHTPDLHLKPSFIGATDKLHRPHAGAL